MAEPGRREPGHRRSAQLRAVRRGLPGDPGRSRLARAGLRFGRRVALLRRPRRGCLRRGRRRAAVLDYVQSWGASILGHAHPAVLEAIAGAAARGTTFGAPTEGEVRLAEAVTEAVPGCDQVRFVSSGTEAAMTVIRLARAATGRDTVVKFAGCYHGHSDALFAGGGSGVATLGLADSAGVPSGAVAATLVAPYNEVPAIDESVACVIVEPVAANMGLVTPVPGYLEGLRSACDRVGALLIFDEVITGFRVGRAGATGLLGVQPDLFCFGKVIGGGLPLAALGGRRDLMSQLAPGGPVYQAGTLSGNPLATAAGLAVLEQPGRGGVLAPGGERRPSRRRPRPGHRGERAPGAGPSVWNPALGLLLRRAGTRLRGRGPRGPVGALRPVLQGHARPRHRACAEPVRDRLRVAGAHPTRTSRERSRRRRRPPSRWRGEWVFPNARGRDEPARRGPCRQPQPARARRAAGSCP